MREEGGISITIIRYFDWKSKRKKPKNENLTQRDNVCSGRKRIFENVSTLISTQIDKPSHMTVLVSLTGVQDVFGSILVKFKISVVKLRQQMSINVYK